MYLLYSGCKIKLLNVMRVSEIFIVCAGCLCENSTRWRDSSIMERSTSNPVSVNSSVSLLCFFSACCPLRAKFVIRWACSSCTHKGISVANYPKFNLSSKKIYIFTNFVSCQVFQFIFVLFLHSLHLPSLRTICTLPSIDTFMESVLFAG